MLKDQIVADLKRAVQELKYKTSLTGTDIVCDIPKNPQFGDYSTNIALQLAKQITDNNYQSSEEIAKQIVSNLGSLSYLSKIEIAGNGFINFFIKNELLIKDLNSFTEIKKSDNPAKILVEYGHVNPLKEIHIGHLRTFILGESLCRILQGLGNEVFRANYQGDIGLHIAKAIWGIEQTGLPSQELTLEQKAEFLGQAYAKGNVAYEADPDFKNEINQINTKLYQKDPSVKQVYELARSWSLEYFQPIYELLDVKYNCCFFESEVFEDGKETILQNLDKVFEKSDGAVIYPGEKEGLHNRVFITSSGHPTYEGKEVGLAKLEYQTFNYDKSIHVVASEQEGYFQVVIKAIEAVFPYLQGKKYHLSYGLVDLKQGKMSSRTGNVVTVDDLLKVVSEKVREIMKGNRLEVDQEVVKKVALGAIKFAYLKFSPRPNMVFDLEKSVSLDGDSGPYLQYTYARINSIIQKVKTAAGDIKEVALDPEERMLLRQLMYFNDVVYSSGQSYHPNVLATYLIELASVYNLFYQKCRVIGSEKEAFRLKLSSSVGDVLQKGLALLGIETPEKM